jgi:hypothetical protein
VAHTGSTDRERTQKRRHITIRCSRRLKRAAELKRVSQHSQEVR